MIITMNKGQCNSIEEKCYENLSQVLKCFVDYRDNSYKHQSIPNVNDDSKKHLNLTKKSFILDSQKWPMDVNNNSSISQTIWRHKLNIYIPDNITHNKALLFIGAGFNVDQEKNEVFIPPREYMDFAQIALNNKAIVVSLEDVPNQYLLMNNLLKKEDQILAYTYKKVMENPMENAYLAGHLPMTKSVVKAMDAVQDILLKENIEADNFVLVGFSKRGWAAWLASLVDDRVSALIPVAIDILNVKKNLIHICNSYKKGCPDALKDYKEQGLLKDLNSKNLEQLMQIEDPFSYINLEEYQKQAAIPKYIINNSGDDFYVPDSSKFYFKYLSGDNYIRYLPQSMHYLAGNPISDYLNNIKTVENAINNFFYFHLNNINLPKISWKFSQNNIAIKSSLAPVKIKLWTAHNDDERDFRLINSHSSKYKMFLKKLAIMLGDYGPFSICDNCYNEKIITNPCSLQESSCLINLDLPKNTKGFSASFAELSYDIDGKEFTVTTEVNVISDSYNSFIEAY